MLQKYASSLGFEPIYCENGEDACKVLLSEDAPKIAVLDWIMPGMTGLEILHQLRNSSQPDSDRQYIIILTAKTEKSDVVTALRAGADDFIKKPFDPEELKARLEAGRRIITLTNRLSSALKKTRQLTDFIVHFDQTTGLPNILSLKAEIENIREDSRHHALFLTNIDNFKIINQIYGIENGDMVLNYAGSLIKRTLGDNAFVARLAADEFAILLPIEGDEYSVFSSQIKRIANSIHRAFTNSLTIEGDKINLTVSNGVSIIEPHFQENPSDFLRKSDFALKRAKKDGGNRTVIHDPESEKQLQERYRLKRELDEAIGTGGLSLFIQPQFAKDGTVTAGEGLVRWLHPQRGMISPGLFIPIAEESDLIVRLGSAVLKMGCAVLKKIENHQFKLAINISPRQFQSQAFVDEVLTTINIAGIDPSRFIFEVTERLFMGEIDNVIAKMEALTATGIEFSIDDFGTGYSSLMYLKQLPINELKIDRAFISGLPSDKNDCAIVKTIVDIGKNLGFRLIAEGIETEEQSRFLASLGEIIFQGFYYGRPEPEEAFLAKYFK